MDEYRNGDMIIVRDGRGHELRKRSLGPVTQGGSFMVVWACREEEWQAAHREGREPEGMPWPAEDVRPQASDVSAQETSGHDQEEGQADAEDTEGSRDPGADAPGRIPATLSK